MSAVCFLYVWVEGGDGREGRGGRKEGLEGREKMVVE